MNREELALLLTELDEALVEAFPALRQLLNISTRAQAELLSATS